MHSLQKQVRIIGALLLLVAFMGFVATLDELNIGLAMLSGALAIVGAYLLVT